MSAPEVKLTKAQETVLLYLVGDADLQGDAMRHRDLRWTGGDLVGLYEERQRAKDDAESRWGYQHDTNRTHGWRRTGGRVLRAMEKAGALQMVGFRGAERGINYVLTPAGRDLAVRLRSEASS